MRTSVRMPRMSEDVIAATKEWLEKTVIGLNLCPFAKAVHAAGQIRYVVSPATTVDALTGALAEEMIGLHEADPAKIDTTLLIHPGVLSDFFEFNDFLNVADQKSLNSKKRSEEHTSAPVTPI